MLARALALLQGDRAGSVTIAALRERGVKAPAQAMYDLQLASHAIDPGQLHRLEIFALITVEIRPISPGIASS